jgi:hypothetical protein
MKIEDFTENYQTKLILVQTGLHDLPTKYTFRYVSVDTE